MRVALRIAGMVAVLILLNRPIMATETADSYLQAANNYFLAKDYVNARQKYEAALSARSGWFEAEEKLADTLMLLGDDQPAIKLFKQLVERYPSRVDFHYALGVLYERQGRTDTATAEYRKVIELDGQHGDALRRMGELLILKGRYREALAHYQKLAQLRPNNPLAHFKTAELLAQMKEYEQAIAEYLITISIASDNVEARKGLGDLLLYKKRYDEAIKHYKEVLIQLPLDDEYRKKLIRLYVKRRRYSELEALVKAWVEHAPLDPESHYRLGLVYEFRKDIPNAIDEYETAINIDQYYAAAQYAVGRLYAKTGQKEKAHNAFEIAQKINPELNKPIEVTESASWLKPSPKKSKQLGK